MARRLAQTHIGQSKPKQGKNISRKQLDEYDRVDRLINEVQVDLINGVLRSDIFRKFNDGLYENLNPAKKIGERQINNYIEAARELIKLDTLEKQEELRQLLFSQYMALYNESTESHNVLVAKQCLDSIAKVFIGDKVSLDANVDSNVNIKFNFNE